jgi:hypothetical protein
MHGMGCPFCFNTKDICFYQSLKMSDDIMKIGNLWEGIAALWDRETYPNCKVPVTLSRPGKSVLCNSIYKCSLYEVALVGFTQL